MFFILSKLLLFLLSPFFWLAVCIILAFWGPTRFRKKFRIAVLVLFLFFTNTVIFCEFARMWEIPGTKIEKIKYYNVGIVLSGMANYNNELNRLTILKSTDRIWNAYTLYKLQKIDRILISGSSGYISNRGLNEAKQFRDVLLKWGAPKDAILVDSNSRNTYENAVETKKLLAQHPAIQSKLLITSATHMRRATGCFERQELICTPFTTNHYTSKKRNYFWDQYLIPNVDNFSNWNKLLKEFVGYIVYDMTGRI